MSRGAGKFEESPKKKPKKTGANIGALKERSGVTCAPGCSQGAGAKGS